MLKTQHGLVSCSAEELVVARNTYLQVLRLEQLRLAGLKSILEDLPKQDGFRLVRHKLIEIAYRDIERTRQVIDEIESAMGRLLEEAP